MSASVTTAYETEPTFAMKISAGEEQRARFMSHSSLHTSDQTVLVIGSV